MIILIKFIEILVSFQVIFISTLIPILLTLPFQNNLNQVLYFPITWQIPIVIIITLIFEAEVIYSAFTIYLFLGLFILPIFHQGGSLGYLLTPNFGYLLGIYPLVKIIDNIKIKESINKFGFLKNGTIAIFAMHFFGVVYSLIQMIFYKETDIFFYNLGNYTIGKIGYHLLMLLPISLLIKPIRFIKHKN